MDLKAGELPSVKRMSIEATVFRQKKPGAKQPPSFPKDFPVSLNLSGSSLISCMN